MSKLCRCVAVGRRVVEGERQVAEIVSETGRAFLIGAVCAVEQELRRLVGSEHAQRNGGGAAFPIRETRGDEQMRACARQKPVQHFWLLHIIVEEEPGFFEAAIRDEGQRRARGFGAVFRLVQARNEDRAQRHEPVHEPQRYQRRTTTRPHSGRGSPTHTGWRAWICRRRQGPVRRPG